MGFVLSSVIAQERKQASASWTSFTQSIDISTEKTRKFIFKGAVKTVSEDSLAWAGLWARVDAKGDGNGFFDNMGDRPIRKREWDVYTIEGTISKNAETLNVGGLVLQDGSFFFDDLSLEIENDNGIMETVPLGNGGLNGLIKDEVIPDWNEGIRKGANTSIKEFEMLSSTDAYEGQFSLLIKGSGTEAMDTGIAEIKPIDGFSAQMGTLISMLDNLKERVEYQTKNMTTYEIDHLHDEKANRMGALIMHLAAAEAFYQVRTFENRGFNEAEQEKWGSALSLGDGARDTFKGKPVSYYLEEFDKVRARTKELFQTQSDEWLLDEVPGYGMNNYFAWFHVMEHQSSHLGQMLFLTKRIPPEGTIEMDDEIKN